MRVKIACFTIKMMVLSIQRGKTMKKKEYIFDRKINSEDLKSIRGRLNMSQAEFARFINVSTPTVERWETSDKPISGPITALVDILVQNDDVADNIALPEKFGTVRIKYYYRNTLCSLIDVDEIKQQVRLYNYATAPLFKAFGNNEKPTYKDYQEFLESRCFPRTRDKMKIALKELNLPFYDPLLIVEKTKGRMAEDDFWLEVE